MKYTAKTQKEILIFLLGLSCLPLLRTHAQATSAHHGIQSAQKPATIQQQRGPKYWSEQKKEFQVLINETWAHEPWIGNDAPYAAARAKIESAVATGESPAVLVAQYAEQAKNEPNNPLAQFFWAYAVRMEYKLALDSKAMSDLRFAAELAIAEAPQPHTYNYNRLHYLLWIQGGGGAPSHFLKDLSYRLLAKDPKDFPVLMGLASIYTQNRDKQAQQKGYALIQQMIKQYPSKPEVYDMLAGWYYTQYMFYHNPKNYHLAIANYQKAMGMYPPQSTRRAGLPSVMEFLTQRYHQISAGGT